MFKNVNNKNKKKIVFRCDASSEIGLGHLSRSLSIAHNLRKYHDITFATIDDITKGYIEKYNFNIFLKKNNELEKNFLNRIASNLKPDIIVMPILLECCLLLDYIRFT